MRDADTLAKIMKIITASADSITAELTEENTETVEAIWSKLPIEGRANTWGDEIYFEIPVTCGTEKPRDVVSFGDVAYWPHGEAICFFFGPTPASKGSEIRLASPVNVFGRIQGDAKVLKLVRPGEKVRLEQA
jgi:uncharacterized protein